MTKKFITTALKKIAVFFLVGWFFIIAATIAPTAHTADNESNQRRLDDFLSQTRCLVCAGESLATSQSLFAQNLRSIISDQFAAGKSEAEIKTYLRARYGDGLFFRPPLRAATFLLWLSPLIFAGVGLLILRGLVRRR